MPSHPKYCPYCKKYYLFSTFQMIYHYKKKHEQPVITK